MITKERKKRMEAETSVAKKISKILSDNNIVGHNIVASDVRAALKKSLSQENKEQVLNYKKTTETKEKAEKDPELEDKDFSVEDIKDRKETTDLNGKRVKVNPEGDAREYLTGNPAIRWPQLFTHAAALRYAHILGKKLPASSATYKDIINKKYGWKYQEFLEKEKMNLNGRYNSKYDRFANINRGFGLRCADGSHILGNRYGMSDDTLDPNFWLSVRFLKE
ncbi:MAG: hypothetical protein ACD_80C00097G0005 [uncultured bacterium (gcode 4)]|uniref:Uncharacterized protein n=1 Tax=uncultured bacterium (gcode 4) TaxID=1234023 RepID=K1XY25_9BACT|nr:MAG: hypothetical protein ACD_80C00097G0005 [uncultured bacterium (gcode 4)]